MAPRSQDALSGHLLERHSVQQPGSLSEKPDTGLSNPNLFLLHDKNFSTVRNCLRR